MAERLFLRHLDGRYCIPADVEIVRVVAWELTPNRDGGTGTHWVYVCLVREIDPLRDPGDAA